MDKPISAELFFSGIEIFNLTETDLNALLQHTEEFNASIERLVTRNFISSQYAERIQSSYDHMVQSAKDKPGSEYKPSVEGNNVTLRGAITGKMVQNTINALKSLNDPTLVMDSPGGSALAGLRLANYVRNHGVATEVDNYAASAASFAIFNSPKVSMDVGALVMIHRPWSCAMGTARDMDATSNALKKIETSMLKMYQAQVNVDRQKLLDYMDAETHFDSDDLTELGLNINADKSPKNNSQSTSQSASESRVAASADADLDDGLNPSTTETPTGLPNADLMRTELGVLGTDLDLLELE